MEPTTINARVKAVRKSQHLNQSEFATAIGLKQGGVSAMEQDGRTVTEQNIALICQKFRVRREWLETGEGEMFNTGEPGIFREFAKEYELSIPEQQVAKYLLKLSHSEREHILTHLSRIALALQEGRRLEREELHRQADANLTAAENRQQVHQQIESGFDETEKGLYR